jgi:hypothetical protein
MTVLFAVLLSRLTDSCLQATVAAIGYERAAAETYKTFFFPSRPRGKFAGKPVLYPEMLTRRRRFVPAYVAIWAAVLAAGGVAAVRELTKPTPPMRVPPIEIDPEAGAGNLAPDAAERRVQRARERRRREAAARRDGAADTAPAAPQPAAPPAAAPPGTSDDVTDDDDEGGDE